MCPTMHLKNISSKRFSDKNIGILKKLIFYKKILYQGKVADLLQNAYKKVIIANKSFSIKNWEKIINLEVLLDDLFFFSSKTHFKQV